MELIAAPFEVTDGPASVDEADTSTNDGYFEPGAIDPIPSGVIGPIFAEPREIALSDVLDYPD